MNDTTWFWQIVDARGLADVSSDEFVALNELISKAERAESAERARDEALSALREKEEESARLTRINTEHCATVNAMNVENAKLEDQLRDVQHRLNIRVRAAMAALKEYHDAYSDYRFAPEGSWEKGDASARLEDARDAARSVLSSVSREQRGEEA